MMASGCVPVGERPDVLGIVGEDGGTTTAQSSPTSAVKPSMLEVAFLSAYSSKATSIKNEFA